MRELYENFFYHFKGAFFGAIFAGVLIGLAVASYVDNVQADTGVMYIGLQHNLEFNTEAISRKFSESVKDTNEDGKRYAQFMVIAGGDEETNPEVNMANQVKFAANISTREFPMVIITKEYCDYFRENKALLPLNEYPFQLDEKKVSFYPVDRQNDEVLAVSIKGNPYFEGIGISTENMYAAILAYPEKMDEEQKNAYDNAFLIMENALS